MLPTHTDWLPARNRATNRRQIRPLAHFKTWNHSYRFRVRFEPGSNVARKAKAKPKLQPDVVLMILREERIASQNIKSDRNTFIRIGPKRTSELTYRGREEVPNMCRLRFLWLHVTPCYSWMSWCFFSVSLSAEGARRKIHLLTDSAILDFWFQPQRHMEAPLHLPEAGSAGWNHPDLCVWRKTLWSELPYQSGKPLWACPGFYYSISQCRSFY